MVRVKVTVHFVKEVEIDVLRTTTDIEEVRQDAIQKAAEAVGLTFSQGNKFTKTYCEDGIVNQLR